MTSRLKRQELRHSRFLSIYRIGDYIFRTLKCIKSNLTYYTTIWYSQTLGEDIWAARWFTLDSDQIDTGLPAKDETSETTVRNLFSHFLTFRVPSWPELFYFCALSFYRPSKSTIDLECRNQKSSFKSSYF